MPRSNQSGGPWGSGPRGPPDLEEFLRGGQDRLRGLMPGNLGGSYERGSYVREGCQAP